MENEIIEKYWSRFPDTYDKNQEYVVGKELLDEITKELNDLPELGELIEFGCGTGYFTETITQKNKNMIATDLSDDLLEIAKKRLNKYQEMTIQKENCMDTSFTSEKFDSVFMANLIHVVENPLKVLQECHRILKDDGMLIIVTFTNYGMKLLEKFKLGIRYLKVWGIHIF